MHLYCLDASEFGLGGYNLVSGNAWRFELPVHLCLRTFLNALEFVACVITIWIDIQLNNIPTESCILSQTDSSSAAGWLRKLDFSDGAMRLSMSSKTVWLKEQTQSKLITGRDINHTLHQSEYQETSTLTPSRAAKYTKF
jgi:hypothetical protein